MQWSLWRNMTACRLNVPLEVRSESRCNLFQFLLYLWKPVTLPCKPDLHLMVPYNIDRLVIITTIQKYQHFLQ